ncbi:hypothetical protein EDD33_0150 [Nocardioides aurantiacus]|uniref:Uncharacterized protein n=1 Tax=Nocardioides aurantiacus TaxID=86796 RepID=A0A3N2CP84_9ACTN|nr:hypothetical protein EDD33_0150 [Nocardioides aurantiacus]
MKAVIAIKNKMHSNTMGSSSQSSITSFWLMNGWLFMVSTYHKTTGSVKMTGSDNVLRNLRVQ